MSESHQDDPIQGRIVHEYDGILEADNQLPRWWLATFFGGIVFAGAYWFAYESWRIAPGPREEYAAAMEAAAASGGEVTDELLTMIADQDDRVAEGATTFATSCAACHGGRGEGLIGPNLTDSAWIHGGAPTQIHATVAHGVGTAGMPAWGPVLGDRQVQSVVAFVLSIRDTNVPGREAQGEVYVPGAAPSGGEGDPAAPGVPAAPADPSVEPAAPEDPAERASL